MKLGELTEFLAEEKEIVLRVYVDGEYFQKELPLDVLAKNKKLMSRTVAGMRVSEEIGEMEIDVV